MSSTFVMVISIVFVLFYSNIEACGLFLCRSIDEQNYEKTYGKVDAKADAFRSNAVNTLEVASKRNSQIIKVFEVVVYVVI